MNRSIWSVLVITMTILLVMTATVNAAPGYDAGGFAIYCVRLPGDYIGLVYRSTALGNCSLTSMRRPTKAAQGLPDPSR